MDKSLKTFTGIIELSRKFNEVRRVVVVDNGRVETDSEHSYQVALCSWFIAQKLETKVNMHKVICYALVHDLPEVGKGDLSSIVATKSELEAKALDEEKTIELLEKRFPTFPELAESIREYEKRESIEAQIVYFVDKVLPVLNVWISKDSYYIDNNITFKIWYEKQWGRIQSLNQYELFDSLIGKQILELIRQNQDQIFQISI